MRLTNQLNSSLYASSNCCYLRLLLNSCESVWQGQGIRLHKARSTVDQCLFSPFPGGGGVGFRDLFFDFWFHKEARGGLLDYFLVVSVMFYLHRRFHRWLSMSTCLLCQLVRSYISCSSALWDSSYGRHYKLHAFPNSIFILKVE